MALLFLAGWIGSFFVVIRRRSERIYSPLLWLLFGWGLIFGLYYTSGIKYFYELKLNGGLYFWGVFLCVMIGYKFSQKYRIVYSRKVKRKKLPRIDVIQPQLYFVLTVLTVMGVVLCAFDVTRLNTISYSLHNNLNISFIGNVGILLTGLGLIAWLFECSYAIQNNVPFRISAFICAFGYIFPALLLSGRQSILIISVSTVITVFYSLSRIKKYNYMYLIIIPFIVIIVALFIYITFISMNRTAVDNKVDLFNYIYKSTYDYEKLKHLDKLGVFKPFVLEVLYYYSHELSMFQVLFDNYQGPNLWGMSQFLIVARNVPIDESRTVFDLLWYHLDNIYGQAGLYSHVWRSAAGNCILDFGRFGGLVYSVVIGYIVGSFYRKCKENQTTYGYIGLSMVCAGMLFSMQFSPICESYWLYPMLWWLVLPFIENFLAKGKNK